MPSPANNTAAANSFGRSHHLEPSRPQFIISSSDRLHALAQAAEQAVRKEQQHDQQDGERNDVLVAGADDDDGGGLHHAEQQAADQRRRRAAEAADDRRDEAVDAERPADAVGGILRRRDQDAGDRAQRRAQREGQRQHARDRDALQRRGLAVDRAGAHRLAGPGQAEEGGERGDDGERAADDPDQLVADRDRSELQWPAGRKAGIGARLIAHRQDDDLLDQQLHRERREDDGEERRLALPHRPDDCDLNQHADSGHGNDADDGGRGDRPAEPHQHRMREHAAEHDEDALRKIHDSAGVIDDAKADRDQPVHEPDADTVDEALAELDHARHVRPPPCRDRQRSRRDGP